MVAGTPPIRAKKARYYEDRRFKERVLPPPKITKPIEVSTDDWSKLALPPSPEILTAATEGSPDEEDTTESERRRQPELSRVQPIAKVAPIENEFEIDPADDADDDAARLGRMNQNMRQVARQASLDPGDGIEL
jgi:type IV secretion system protein VirD4